MEHRYRNSKSETIRDKDRSVERDERERYDQNRRRRVLREKRRRKRRKQVYLARTIFGVAVLMLLLLIVFLVRQIGYLLQEDKEEQSVLYRKSEGYP